MMGNGIERKSNLDLSAAAILVWLPKGESPQDPDFDCRQNLAPPHPNPECWWHLHEAISYAWNRIFYEENAGKFPWIKTGIDLIDPAEVDKIYKSMGQRFQIDPKKI